MTFKINVFLTSPSPHMMDLWEEINKNKNVKLTLFFQESRNADKPWGEIDDALQAKILHWSSKTLIQKIYLLRNITDYPADIWVFSCDSYWMWENYVLVSSLHKRMKKICLVVEPICWEKKWLPKYSLYRVNIFNNIKKSLLLILMNRFDVILGVGAWGVQQYRNLFPKKPIFEIKYYVDLNTHCSIEIRNKKEDDNIIFGYCGQLIPRKGLHILIKQLNMLAAYNNWQLIIAGEGQQRKLLEKMIPDNIRNRVLFLGFLNEKEIMKFWEEIDVFIFPSLFDGWGMVVVEALAAGVPVLSGEDVGAARNYIYDGENGWIRKVNDDFLNPIRGLLGDPGQINLMSNAARKSVKNYKPEIGALELVKNLHLLVN
jgi:glycosyltransferase involved in cell wall biosynthesis